MWVDITPEESASRTTIMNMVLGQLNTLPSSKTMFSILSRLVKAGVKMDKHTYDIISSHYIITPPCLPSIRSIGGLYPIQRLLEYVMVKETASFATLLKYLFGDVNSITTYMPGLLIYNELETLPTNSKLFQHLFKYLTNDKSDHVDTTVETIIGNYLVLGRDDLATAWFCRSIETIKRKPSNMVSLLFEKHLAKSKVIGRAAMTKYYLGYIKPSGNKTAVTSLSTEPSSEPCIVESNARSLALLPPRCDGSTYTLIADPADLPATLNQMAPDYPVAYSITRMPMDKVFNTPGVPSYAKVIASLSFAKHQSLETTINLILDNEPFMFHVPSTTRFLEELMFGLIKEKQAILFNRLLQVCLEKKIHLNMVQLIKEAVMSGIVTNTFTNTLIDHGQYYTKDKLIEAFVTACQGDYIRSEYLYNESLGNKSNATMRSIVGAMVWAGTALEKNRTLAGFERFQRKEMAKKSNIVLCYDAAFHVLQGMDALANLPSEYVGVRKAAGQEDPNVQTSFEMIEFILRNSKTPKAMASAYKTLYNPAHVLLPADIYETLCQQSSNDPQLVKLLEPVTAISRPAVLSNRSLTFINDFIDSLST
eukprot:gene7428-8689_t